MNAYAVITGASSGIGAEFARQLAEKGYGLILVARREERLQQLAAELNTQCDIILADLSNEQECYSLYEKIRDKDIEVFINNAGFGDCSPFLDGHMEKELAMIQVNIKAVHILTKLVLQQMQKQNKGYLLNVASVAGLMPAGPYLATYYATKAYVTSFTQAIARELKEKGSSVYIGCLCPGPVDTEFNRCANAEFAVSGISATSCVREALKKMWNRKTVIVPNWIVRFGLLLGRLLPRKVFIICIGMVQKQKIA